MGVFIAAFGITVLLALYLEQIITILDTGNRSSFLAVLTWLVGAVTAVTLLVSR